MKINFRGEEWLLGWKHEIFKTEQTGETFCYMKNRDGDTIEAGAKCTWPDKYNRKTGRKLSLQRLTNVMGMKREEKRYLWNKVMQEVDMID